MARRFELLELADVGGSARLFRARDQRTGALVGFKLATQDARTQARLAAEGAALRDISLPAIPRLIGTGRAGGMPYLITEWREGRSLRSLLREEISAPRAFAIARQLLAAVGALHQQGWIHGDICPASVLVNGCGSEPTVTLLDLGHARRMLGGDARGAAADLLPAPTCAAPELLAGAPSSIASDLYAVGGALAALLGTAAGEFGSAAVGPLVRRAMHPDPGKRFDSALAMRRALEAAMLADGSVVTRRPCGDLGEYSITTRQPKLGAQDGLE